MDNRQNARIPVEPQCRARLRLDRGPLFNLPVVNLGPGGCCIEVPPSLASTLLGRSSIGDLELVHPSLSRGTVKGQITWVHGLKTAGAGAMAVGVQFTETPGGFAIDMAEFEEMWARYERSHSRFDGMPA